MVMLNGQLGGYIKRRGKQKKKAPPILEDGSHLEFDHVDPCGYFFQAGDNFYFRYGDKDPVKKINVSEVPKDHGIKFYSPTEGYKILFQTLTEPSYRSLKTYAWSPLTQQIEEIPGLKEPIIYTSISNSTVYTYTYTYHELSIYFVKLNLGLKEEEEHRDRPLGETAEELEEGGKDTLDEISPLQYLGSYSISDSRLLSFIQIRRFPNKIFGAVPDN